MTRAQAEAKINALIEAYRMQRDRDNGHQTYYERYQELVAALTGGRAG